MIKELTKKQKEATTQYRDEAIRIGLHATPEPMDEKLVRELTDAHRVSRGVPKAKNFIVCESPWQVLETYGKKYNTITVSTSLGGQHDVSWLWYYKFFRDECGLVKQVKPLNYLIELCHHVNWMWMSSDATIAVRKPVEAHLVNRKRAFIDVNGNSSTFDCPTLHNPEGMALVYADGRGLYKINNVDFFDKQSIDLINTPANLMDAAQVMAIKNTEHRSLLIQKMGIGRVFDKLNKKLLHTKTFDIGGTYELYELYLNNSRRVYLSGKCPSKGDIFCERVPPNTETVDQALQWRQDWALGRVQKDELKPVDHVYNEPKAQS